ncbi:PPE domain-containing protein [Gordonia polyisoprenivorans]|uniref:PPE domain-containing protein n=1 Tax=Gordonia polyisoprenivorans TaxID=84595 RepID=UPI002301A005|nr:PPE domain-containing protein [Gordonia polyisoprenivorans]WCB36040.1 PPE domain-containing protein [Gordonia polyisoprenivorans]
MTGFTGVLWDTRTSRRLASDLVEGLGASAFADAAIAWGALAGEFTGAAAEYGAVLARLRADWESGAATDALDRLDDLLGWLTDMAAQATEAAAMTEAQSLAVSVARLAMPSTAEVDLADTLAHGAAVAASVAPIATGAAAHAERAVHDQRMRAARVMEAYETAAEPLAQPWRAPCSAPQLVPDTPPVTTSSRSPQTPVVPAAAGHGSGAGTGIVAPMMLSAPTPRGAYTPTMVASAPAASPTAVTTAGAGQAGSTTSGASSALPPPMAPMTSTASMGDRVVRVDTQAQAEIGQAEASPRSPETWAEVAAQSSTALDPRYVEQTLILDTGRTP